MWVVLWAHAGALEKTPHLPIIHLRMNAKDYRPEEGEKALRACDPNYW